MSDVDRIYQKYIAVFYELDLDGGGSMWIDLSAVRYALRAALREMADGVRRDTERLIDWLCEYAPDEFDAAFRRDGDAADAMIAAADRLREQVAKLRLELATAIDERNAADVGCADAERKRDDLQQQLIALDADNAKLTQELAILRSYALAPKDTNFGIATTNGDVAPAAHGTTATAGGTVGGAAQPGEEV